MVKLPTRVDQIHHLNFTAAERENYEAVRSQSRKRLEEAISSGNQSGKTFNALSLLNNLRLICNHGLLARSTLEKTSQQCSSERSSPGEISNALFGEVLDGSTSCSICGANLLDDILEGAVSGFVRPPKRAECDQMICELCISDQMTASKLEPSLQMPLRDSSRPTTPVPDSKVTYMIESMSTKIKVLVNDLYKHKDVEKSYKPLLSGMTIWLMKI